MKAITSQDSIVYFNSECYVALNEHIAQNNYSKIFLITDENTFEYCYPTFVQQLATETPIEVIQIQAGEVYKNIDTCSSVWNVMSELDGDRKCLVINIGGGVVTDLGGFVACTYKRGVNYINIPTSLLAMVDASVGGKTGVDLGTLKNQIGVISTPEMVLIDTAYLATLPANQMRSGLAEMLKHGLIQDKEYWTKMSDLSQLTSDDLDQLIYDSVIIKNNVVTQDPTENGIRKTLNFGHTLGHAIESYYLEHDNRDTLLHGEAVAIGMILAAYISTEISSLSKAECDEIKEVILATFDHVKVPNEDISPIVELMKFDKKNSHGNIYFVLLEAIGETVIDCIVPNDTIQRAFDYYNA